MPFRQVGKLRLRKGRVCIAQGITASSSEAQMSAPYNSHTPTMVSLSFWNTGAPLILGEGQSSECPRHLYRLPLPHPSPLSVLIF